MATATLNTSLTLNGTTTLRTDSFETDGQQTVGPKTLTAALEGELTTRTDNDTGVITLAAGHGITTSDFVAVGWTDDDGYLRCRFYMDVTAAAATTISVDLGTGANLPTVNTEVTVSIVTNDDFSIDPEADAIDPLKPKTILSVGVAAAGQQVAAFFALSTDVAGGTLTNGKLIVVNGSLNSGILWGGLNDFEGFPTDVDKVYWGPLSTTAPVVTAQSLYNT